MMGITHNDVYTSRHKGTAIVHPAHMKNKQAQYHTLHHERRIILLSGGIFVPWYNRVEIGYCLHGLVCCVFVEMKEINSSWMKEINVYVLSDFKFGDPCDGSKLELPNPDGVRSLLLSIHYIVVGIRV